MRRLNNCILIVIFITILISGWSLDRRIVTARVFLHHVANQLPSSPEVVAEEHEMVDKMQIVHQKELVELKKTLEINFNHDFQRVVKARSRNEGHKTQLELIASVVATIGGSLFVITIVLLVCANEASPRKVETPLLSQTEESEKEEAREPEGEDATEIVPEAAASTSFASSLKQSFISKGPSMNPASLIDRTPSVKPSSLVDRKFSVKPSILVDKVPSMKPPRAPTKEFVIPINNNVGVAPPPPSTNSSRAPPPPPSNVGAPPPPPPNSKGPAPPAPPPNLRGPPPPPMGGGRGPPPPPMKGGGGPRAAPPPGNAAAQSTRAKLKPFFWDKVQASPQQSMIWDEIRAGSFQFNEAMIEDLFGYSADEKKGGNDRKAKSAAPTVIHLIDAKKSQNLSILLKALNVTTKEVCDALMEGNELPVELLQTLIKMAPTSDEELKLRLFSGDPSLISSAERFLKALSDIPFAYKRMDCLLFMITLKEEIARLKESFSTLEMASNKLTSNRIFLKLLEAVLKTGNRMNDGTYRGGAQAFKLDTLLKLADVKGKDGKTTLLHFLVQEVIRSEGRKMLRAARDNCSISSVSSDDFVEDTAYDPMENVLVLGLPKVSGLSTELEVVKKAAIVDADALTTTAARLGHSLLRTKDFLNKDMRDLEEESRFQRVLKDFVEESEVEITNILQEERRIMDLVKKTVEHFHGNAAKEEGLKLFGTIRDFMVMLDKICAEIQKTINQPPKANKDNSGKKKESSSSSSSTIVSDQTTKTGSNVASTSGTSTEERPSEAPPAVSTQEPHPQPQASSSSSVGEQLTKTLSQERAVEEMRQKLVPMTSQDANSDESSSSSSDDGTPESSTRGSRMEVPFQEGYLQASSANAQMRSQESAPQPQASSSSSVGEQLTKTLSQERAVEVMRQKLMPMSMTSQDTNSDESSSSSSDDGTPESSTRGSRMEVPFQEGYLQASSANAQMRSQQARVKEYLADVNSSRSVDDSSSSSSDGS